MDDKQRFRWLGLVLIIFGLLSVMGNRLPIADAGGGLFLVLVGAGLLWGWAQAGALGLLIAGACTIALGAFALVESVFHIGDWGGPLFFLSQAGAFYGVYALGKDRPGWAKYASWGLVGFSIFVAATQGIGLFSKLVVPALLILVGLWLFSGRKV